MNLNKTNTYGITEIQPTPPKNTYHISKYEYMHKLANDCLYDIHNGERVCVTTNLLLQVIMVTDPNINIEWNKEDECYWCYK